MTPATAPNKTLFHKEMNGALIDLVVLTNSQGVQAAITNYGARWVSFLTPGKDGLFYDVIAGFDSIDGYLNATEFYYGATIGRCANRIRNASIELEGKVYPLTKNKGAHHLHGGVHGFQAAVWAFEKVAENTVTLAYLSKDGEEGYPGNLQVTVTYTLNDANELAIRFWALTDKTTIVNLTNHAFFNLNGQGCGTILDHQLYINADAFTPMDAASITTGEIAPVSRTPFDFREPTRIGARIEAGDPQLKNGNGYDHNFVLQKTGSGLERAAVAVGDKTGICMEVSTTEPGMQLYTGNFMDGSNTLKGSATDERRSAFCLETQHFPDAPHHPHFPSIILHPGQTFQSETVFRFSIAG